MKRVYAFQDAVNGMVKIGVSEDVLYRFRKIKTVSPFLNLRIAAESKASSLAYDHERAWHNRLKHYRVHGEWFALPGKLSKKVFKWISANKHPKNMKSVRSRVERVLNGESFKSVANDLGISTNSVRASFHLFCWKVNRDAYNTAPKRHGRLKYLREHKCLFLNRDE